MNLGKFITFEGGEGCGKSTQSRLLKEAFEKAQLNVIYTREPGGTEGAESIRNLLVRGAADKWDVDTELFLFFAARIDHVVKLISPSLKKGINILCDRFSDSTIAYQVHGYGVPIEKIRRLQRLTISDSHIPDVTFLLDLDVETGLRRANSRNDKENRYESMGIDFHKRVRDGYKYVASKNEKRCMVLDATETICNLHHEIINTVNNRFGFNLEAVI